MKTRDIYYWLRPEMRLLIRRLYYSPRDFFDKLLKREESIIPPKGLIFIGGGDFKSIGSTYLSRFIEYGGLKPDHRVLDIGCGIGRIALPLTSYISKLGSYEGFDVVKTGINWCQKHITPIYPNFIFRFINLKNKLYNSENENLARDFNFPYQNREFDFIILTSVFTHMLPEDMEHYLNEIYRVLKPNGKCYATFFLLNSTSKMAMVNNDGLNFTYNHGDYWTLSKELKEANVAYEELYLINHYLKLTNFRVERLLYGYWSGMSDKETMDFQDTIIMSKVAESVI